MPRRLLISSLLLCASTSRADFLFVPQPALQRFSGTLESALLLGRRAAALEASTGNGRGSSGLFAASVALPLLPSDIIRFSGWSWGASAGATEFQYDPAHNLNPSTFFWEVVLGRGTTEPITGEETGLRGYLEVAFRDEAPLRDPALEAALSASNFTLPNHRHAVALRMGVAQEATGTGLVEQKAPTYGFRAQGGIYLPAGSNDRLFLTLETEVARRCGTDRFVCGLFGRVLRSSNAMGMGGNAELHTQFLYGFQGQYEWSDHFALIARIPWAANFGRVDARTRNFSHPALPSVSLGLQISI